jgi:hypothetical protein
MNHLLIANWPGGVVRKTLERLGPPEEKVVADHDAGETHAAANREAAEDGARARTEMQPAMRRLFLAGLVSVFAGLLLLRALGQGLSATMSSLAVASVFVCVPLVAVLLRRARRDVSAARVVVSTEAISSHVIPSKRATHTSPGPAVLAVLLGLLLVTVALAGPTLVVTVGVFTFPVVAVVLYIESRMRGGR